MTSGGDVSGQSGPGASYRRIFQSTLVIGGASVVNVLCGLVRMKVAAVLLGPAGIGIIGILGAIIGAASTIAQLGMITVGTRQIAEAHASGDAEKVAISRRALFTAAMVLALLGGTVIWFVRTPLANWTFGGARDAMMLAVAVGVALSVAGTAQAALIQGMRRMGDLAVLSMLGAVITTIVGLPLLWVAGEKAIPAYVVLAPLGAFLIGLVIVTRIPRGPKQPFTLSALLPHWVMFVRLGVPFMAASVALAGAELFIRIDVRQQLGLGMVGQFQASWTIAAQYVGFVLSAMAADYYPRLTATLAQRPEAVALINQQSEVALLLSGGAILAMFGWAPMIIALLYSPDFLSAAEVLRWQAAATIFKVLSWPLGFVLLAAGAGTTFLMTEAATAGLMVVLVHFLLPTVGLPGAGIAYFLAYGFYMPLIYWLVARRFGFIWSRSVIEIAGALALFLLALVGIQLFLPNGVAIATFVALFGFGAFAVRRLHDAGMTTAIRGLISKRIAKTMKN